MSTVGMKPYRIDRQRTVAHVMAKNHDLHPLPVLDFSKFHAHSEARSLAIRDVGNACKNTGYFQIVNHGIDIKVIDGALEAASAFFDLSPEKKAEFASDDMSKPVRYGTSSKDGISKARDLLKLYAHPLNDWIHLWPTAPQCYREKMGNYVIEARRVALELMGAIIESLGLDQSYLEDQFDNGMQVIATNFYPRSSQPNLEVGLDSHSDYGFITILLETCPGLQVKDQDEKPWRDVPLLPGALHVQIGDYIEVLSNGRYKSVIHRALLNHDEKRISIASILNLSMDAKVAPAKEMVDKQNPKGYRETNFREFLNFLSAADYKNKNSYIEHLRIDGN